MSNEVKLRIKQRIDTKENWAKIDPVLLVGEIAFTSNDDTFTNPYKIGDGTSKWSELDYNISETPIMVGATESKNGISGLVPVPTIDDKDKFLKGDGTWYDINADVNNLIGDLSQLETTDKNNLVSAINELEEYIPSDTTSTDNKLTNKLYVDTQLSVFSTEHTVIIQNMAETTATIAPNVFYIWDEIEELNITLGDPSDEDIYNEYMFQFTSGDTATTLSLPDNITWYLGNNNIISNKTYQISIVNNLAVLGEF